MKRVLAIVFVLQILISSACMAFELSTDKRWTWLGFANKCGYWIDNETIYYHISNIYSHKGHKQIDVWLLVQNADENTSYKFRSTYDLTCLRQTLTYAVKYNSKNEVIASYSYPNDFQDIIPNSIGEDILRLFTELWDIDPRNNFR